MAIAVESPEYITVDQAAVMAGISSVTVRRAVRKGDLVYRARKGQVKLLRADEVRKWADENYKLREISPEEE